MQFEEEGTFTDQILLDRTYFSPKDGCIGVTVDLSRRAGLALELEEPSLNLLLGKGLSSEDVRVRNLTEIRGALRDRHAKGPSKLYFMYRDLHLKEHRKLFRAHNMRYDVTVMGSGFIGKEFLKTMGHYHPMIPGLGLSYPEVYEVLHGGAIYLLQKIRTLADPRRTVDLVAMEAREGDRVVIPPNYGHVTINPYGTPLVMADLTADGFESIYEPYLSLGGAAYHLLSERGKAVWEPNPRYINPPALRKLEAGEFPELGLSRGRALYGSVVRRPERFEFLNNPLHHMDFLGGVLRG